MLKHILIFLLFSLIFTSCEHFKKKSFQFDETVFRNTKEKWSNSNISNYEFKYTFDSLSAGPAFIYGKSTICDLEPSITILCLHHNYLYYDGQYYYIEPRDFSNLYKWDELPDEKENLDKSTFDKEVKRLEEIQKSTIQLKTIDEVFNLIEDRVTKQRENYNNDSNIVLYSMSIEYDSQYGIPKRIIERIERKTDPKPSHGLEGFTTTSLKLDIEKFKTLSRTHE